MQERIGSATAPSALWAYPATMWRRGRRALGFEPRLYGNFKQAIDASVVRGIGDQLGLINITTARAGDPDLERQIVEEVASYGRQLGRLLDAVDVLIRRDTHTDLTAEDHHAFDELERLRDEIATARERFADERVDRIVADIHALRQDPTGNQAALSLIREALDDR